MWKDKDRRMNRENEKRLIWNFGERVFRKIKQISQRANSCSFKWFPSLSSNAWQDADTWVLLKTANRNEKHVKSQTIKHKLKRKRTPLLSSDQSTKTAKGRFCSCQLHPFHLGAIRHWCSSSWFSHSPAHQQNLSWQFHSCQLVC